MADFVSSRKQGPVGIVVIDRPERRNALNLQVKREIVERLQALAHDAEVAVIVLSGGAATSSPAPTSPRWRRCARPITCAWTPTASSTSCASARSR